MEVALGGVDAVAAPHNIIGSKGVYPLHFALSGCCTPICPVVIRTPPAVDPASATLGDEGGRTPLSLIFDDYVEEIMEALEDDILSSTAQEWIEKGGLNNCWDMLRVLLQRGDLWRPS